jgi:predicted peroxiredoxin
MMEQNSNQQAKHLIVLTQGREDGGARATLSLALAASLLAMGGEVAVYLNFQAVYWGMRGATRNIHIPGFDTLETYLDLYREMGGQMYACAACLEAIADPLSGKTGLDRLRPGIEVAGITTLATLMRTHHTVTF